jgi:putative membrane protein
MSKSWTKAFVAFLVLFDPLLALAQQSTAPQQAPWGWSGPMWHGGWGFSWVFPLLMVLMMIVCIGGMLFGRRSGGGRMCFGSGHHASRPERSWADPTCSALEILNERFARGEIQKQEFEERRATILALEFGMDRTTTAK